MASQALQAAAQVAALLPLLLLATAAGEVVAVAAEVEEVVAAGAKAPSNFATGPKVGQK